jgi:hypothetical protein
MSACVRFKRHCLISKSSVDRDISPGPGQLERARAPDASPRSGHQRLPAQKLHIQVPPNQVQSRTVTYL